MGGVANIFRRRYHGTMIRLSKRQRGEADRVGGIELILPYPSHLTPPSLDECVLSYLVTSR